MWKVWGEREGIPSGSGNGGLSLVTAGKRGSIGPEGARRAFEKFSIR